MVDRLSSRYSPSALVAGGFRVAQLVRIEREPSHCPFMAVMAVSASCKSGQIKWTAIS